MKIHRMVQGSAEWHAIRCGKVTAGGMDKILTPKTLKLSSSSVAYRHRLLAEWLLGRPLEFEATQFMERGLELEEEARAAYEWETGHVVEQVGFVEESEDVGGSPDGLIDSYGGLEIKCFEYVHHIGALVEPENEYRLQVQGLMMVTGRKWWDLWYYNPELPSVRLRVERDETVIAALRVAVDTFVEQLRADKAKLMAMGCNPTPPRDECEHGVDRRICRECGE